jgi:hypothetical protein
MVYDSDCEQEHISSSIYKLLAPLDYPRAQFDNGATQHTSPKGGSNARRSLSASPRSLKDGWVSPERNFEEENRKDFLQALTLMETPLEGLALKFHHTAALALQTLQVDLRFRCISSLRTLIQVCIIWQQLRFSF